MFLNVFGIETFCAWDVVSLLFVESFLSRSTRSFRGRDFYAVCVIPCAWHKLHLNALR